jgi:uncharacterized membrane protein YtjA (UPF0391 family)
MYITWTLLFIVSAILGGLFGDCGMTATAGGLFSIALVAAIALFVTWIDDVETKTVDDSVRKR